ncbi:MAG: ATP-binding protein [Chlorobaculum sp.]|nr:ATP-binding protein [Chlorobaculum sp.]
MSSYRFSFPSKVEHCRQLRQWVGVFARIEALSEQFLSILELSVHEAFINAVRHGNHDDPAFFVVVSLQTTAAHFGGCLLEVRQGLRSGIRSRTHHRGGFSGEFPEQNRGAGGDI